MKVLLGLFVILLMGCGVSSFERQGYHEDDFLGFGYTENRLEENLYVVECKLPTNSTLERAKDYSMLRAAEITLREGYLYFTKVHDDFNKDSQFQGDGVLSLYGIANSSVYPSNALLIVRLHKVETKGKRKEIFDAELITEILRAKYQLKD
jgi:hypothetical protein